MKGLPFYGAAETFANMAMSDSLLGDEDEPWEFNTWVNTKVGDTAFYGGFNKIFGTDVASRTGFGNMLFPYANPYKQEQLGVWYYPIAFAGPSAGIVEGWYDSAELFSEGQTPRA